MESFPRYWPFVRGIHQSPVNSPHKGQWHRALMFSLICAWMNGWVNNREAVDLRRQHAHYDVTVMDQSLRKTDEITPQCGRRESQIIAFTQSLKPHGRMTTKVTTRSDITSKIPQCAETRSQTRPMLSTSRVAHLLHIMAALLEMWW